MITGDYATARTYFEHVLGVCREVGDRFGEALALQKLGELGLRTADYTRARGFFEQAQALFREMSSRPGESTNLAYLGLLFLRSGDVEAAWEYGQRALSVARGVEAGLAEGYALTVLGHALVERGRLEEAATAYRDAVDLRRESGQHALAMESLAGLVRVSLAQGHLARAQANVEEILTYLETATLGGADEPFLVYLTCFRALRANQDARAREILTTGHDLLQEWAARMSDEALRRSFLDTVPLHRELMTEWKKETVHN